MKHWAQYVFMVIGLLLLFGCGKADDVPQSSGSPEDELANEVFASGFYAAILEDGKFRYLYNSENRIDFDGYECAAIVEDIGIPGIITAEGKFVSAYPMTAEEREQGIRESFDAAAEAEGNYGVGNNADEPGIMRQMEQLTNLKQVVSSYPYYYVALKQDGTVVLEGLAEEANELETWTDIVQIAVGGGIYGLKKDGTVCANFSSEGYSKKIEDKISNWTDIISIVAGEGVFGLKKDGTVVSTAVKLARCEEWTDIVALSASSYAIAGLKKDGTVVVECWRCGFEPEDVMEWTDIEKIAVCDQYCIGIRTDGTIVRTDLEYD